MKRRVVNGYFHREFLKGGREQREVYEDGLRASCLKG